MRLNRKRLHAQGFNTRILSVGEGVHFSMQNGFDGIKATHQPYASAGAMMDKLLRRCKDIGFVMIMSQIGNGHLSMAKEANI